MKRNAVGADVVLVTLLFMIGNANGQVCDSYPCQNQGTCIETTSTPRGYRCECPEEWIGIRCEHPDQCVLQNVSCENGGTCYPSNATCACPEDFVGDFCEFDNPCSGRNPCRNGGTCSVLISDTAPGADYECDCTMAYDNPDCMYLRDIPECFATTCDNDGTCVDDGIGVYCECPPFIDGPYCERFTSCDNNPCLHGGSCVNTGSGNINHCVCPEQWTGIVCETPLSCSGNPCQNGGMCIPEDTGVTCDCTPMWEGPTCEDRIPSCINVPCENGGCCLMTGQCECAPFYTGSFCEDMIPYCDSDPCQNGATCENFPGSYYCNCPIDYAGINCEDMVTDPCVSQPCLNGGTCSDLQNGLFECQCATGYQGSTCQDVTPAPPSQGLSTTTIGIIAGCVAGVVVVIVIVIAIGCCCCRRHTAPDKRHLALEMGVNQNQQKTKSHDYVPSPTRTLMPAIPNLKVSSMRDESKLEFPRNRLTILTKLGSGSFADVYKAEAMGISNKDTKSIVAVKMLKETATENDKRDLSKELSLFMYLDPHPNIVNILGCCTDSDPWYIIMEYLPHGNLQGYLRQIRTGKSKDEEYKNTKKQTNVPPNDLLTFSFQIARAMEYLASKACIHRDLAARNILLGEGLVCKVSDFGLARDLEDGQTYEMKSQGRVPVRWMSPESLLHNTYTSQSDVWSFGILIWEIVTLGSHPYPGMASKEVIKQISAGYRLPKPEHCSQEIYDLMKECWNYDPEERPTFSQIKQQLENMLADAQGYLVMSDFNDDNYLYLEPDQQTRGSLDDDVVLSHL